MSGLDPEQLDELVWRIEEQLEEPWHKGVGRPKDLSLREAAVVASGYMRQNIIQEVWAEIFDTSQPVISAIIANSRHSSGVHRRGQADCGGSGRAVAREQTVLVDGFLRLPGPGAIHQNCGRESIRQPSLWSPSRISVDLLFVSEPVAGHNHDMTALAETETADVMAATFSGIGDKLSGLNFFTPFKKPQGYKLLHWQKEFNTHNRLVRLSRAIAHLNPGVFSTPIPSSSHHRGTIDVRGPARPLMFWRGVARRAAPRGCSAGV